MSFRDMDYFDLLRLDGKPARFIVEGSKAWFDCDGQRFDMDAGDLREQEMDMRKGMDLDTLMKESKPMAGNLDVRGMFAIANLEDQLWLFVFVSPDKHMCLLRAESFDKTLGKI